MELLYRACSEKEIDNFYEVGFITPMNHQFISLSHNRNIAESFLSKESNMIITYDKHLLMKQGGLKIDYSIEFFEQHPEIALHCDSGGDYKKLYEYLTYDIYNDDKLNELTDEEFELHINESLERLFYDITKQYQREEEFVIESIIYEPGLIIDIEKIYQHNF